MENPSKIRPQKSRYAIVAGEALKGKTLARALMSAELNRLFAAESWLAESEKILEIGGEPASHQRYLPTNWRLTLSNFAPLAGVDLIIDAEKPFPLADNEYDAAICFNALYIIKNYQTCVAEALRVSKRFVMFNVPLIQALVPEPKDYTRLTEDRISEMFQAISAEGRIIPVGGSFSAAVSLIDPYLKFRFVRLPFYWLAMALDNLDRKIGRKCPIMYIAIIRKPYER